MNKLLSGSKQVKQSFQTTCCVCVTDQNIYIYIVPFLCPEPTLLGLSLQCLNFNLQKNKTHKQIMRTRTVNPTSVITVIQCNHFVIPLNEPCCSVVSLWCPCIWRPDRPPPPGAARHLSPAAPVWSGAEPPADGAARPPRRTERVSTVRLRDTCPFSIFLNDSVSSGMEKRTSKRLWVKSHETKV